MLVTFKIDILVHEGHLDIQGHGPEDLSLVRPQDLLPVSIGNIYSLNYIAMWVIGIKRALNLSKSCFNGIAHRQPLMMRFP